MDLCESESSDDVDADDSGASSNNTDTPCDYEREPMPKKQKLISSTRKYSGSARYATNYQSSWEKTYNFNFVTWSSSKGHFYYKVCCKDVSIKRQEALDIERHSEGKTH